MLDKLSLLLTILLLDRSKSVGPQLVYLQEPYETVSCGSPLVEGMKVDRFLPSCDEFLWETKPQQMETLVLELKIFYA